MAAYAAKRMVVHLGTTLGGPTRFQCIRTISQDSDSNGNHLFLVNTLALVRRLESKGVPSKQAEAYTASLMETLNGSLEHIANSYVSKFDLDQVEMTHVSNLSKFKSEVQISQENHFSLYQRETEKLRTAIEKMQSELRYEIDKVTAGHRLDQDLEKGRVRDVLSNQKQEISNLSSKLDREIHSLRAELEAAKSDVVKYCVGAIVSMSAFALAVVRILK